VLAFGEAGDKRFLSVLSADGYRGKTSVPQGFSCPGKSAEIFIAALGFIARFGRAVL